MLTAAIYVRYSDDRQSKNSIRDQLRNCRTWADKERVAIYKIYSDEGISGARTDRPGYKRLLKDARKHRFNIIIVDDLSRFGRDFGEGARALAVLRFHGVRVISVSDGIDTDQEAGKLLANIRGLMNDVFLDTLASDVRRGQLGQFLAGYSAGGIPYGYRSFHDGSGARFRPDPVEAAIVREIFQRYADGQSPRTIARALNERGVPGPRGKVWSSSSIYPDRRRRIGILANPIYKGDHIWGRSEWIRHPETGRRLRLERPESEWTARHDPALQIVPLSLWNAAEARSERVSRKGTKSGRPPSPRYLFSGLLECGACGASYVIIDRYRYGCSRHKNSGDQACSNGIPIPREALEQQLLAEIRSLFSSKEILDVVEALQLQFLESEQQKRRIRRELRAADRKFEDLLESLADEDLENATKEETASIRAEMRILATAIREKEQLIRDPESPYLAARHARDEWHQKFNRLKEMDLSDIPSAQKILGSLIRKIVLKPDRGGLVATIRVPLPEALGAPIPDIVRQIRLGNDVR